LNHPRTIGPELDNPVGGYGQLTGDGNEQAIWPDSKPQKSYDLFIHPDTKCRLNVINSLQHVFRKTMNF